MILLPILAPAMLAGVVVLALIVGDRNLRQLRSARNAAVVIVITLLALVGLFVMDYQMQSNVTP